MNTPENISQLYSKISDSIDSAMADILALNIEHKDGKREIGNITDKLRDIQTRFDRELHQLKTQAEWDTFTLAFFGETNAGKSTIIESLRILFKEESRQALLQQHADDLEKFSQALNVHLEHVREGLYALYSEYTDELIAISQSIGRLTRIAQQEAQARLEVQQQEVAHRQQLAETEAKARHKLAEDESSARLATEQQETSQRLQIEQANALSRFKVRLALVGGGGFLIGTTVAVALLKLAGA